MQLRSLTIFATGVVNRKETSHKTLICVRPENPVLVPFDRTTTAVWIVHKQTVVLNVTDGGADLKSRAIDFQAIQLKQEGGHTLGDKTWYYFFRLEILKSV